MTEVTVTLPRVLTPYTLDKLRSDPKTAYSDTSQMHQQIGWLLAAWELIIEERTMDSLRDEDIVRRLQELEDIWWPVAKAARENFDIPLGASISQFIIDLLQKHSEKKPACGYCGSHVDVREGVCVSCRPLEKTND